jgi:O-antigen/teichoic acid export membrane protein
VATIRASLESRAARIWHSPALNTISASLARGIAYLVPLPFVAKALDINQVALWLLFATMHSLTVLAIGNLPVILMHMVAHAHAGKGTPRDRLSTLALGITNTFNWATLFYVLLAILVFTPLLWRQINLTNDDVSALVAWGIFVVGAVFRIQTLTFTTYLLGLNQVADVRRMETFSWAVGGVASAIGLLVWPNMALAMALLQAPALLNLVSMRKLAIRKNWSKLLASSSNSERIWDKILPRAIKGTLGLVLAYLTVYGSSIIYAQVGDSASIASFSFLVTLFGVISQIAVGHTMASLPAMSQAYAAKNREALHSTAKRSNNIGILIYLALLFISWMIYQASIMAVPGALPSIDFYLFILFCLAYLPVRYASFHLHLYTITNDMRWHHYQIGVAIFYFPLIFIFGIDWLPTYPLALFIANLAFAVPFARYLTFSKINFVFAQEKTTLLIMFVSVALLAALLTAGSALDAPAGLTDRP